MYKFIDLTKSSIDVDAIATIQVKRIVRISSSCKKTATIVHVGAFDGQVSLNLVEMLKPLKTSVIALEPCIRNFKLLKKAFESNSELHALHCAAGARVESRNISIKHESTEKRIKGSSQSNSFYSEFVNDKDSGGYAEHINVVSLQNIFNENNLKTVDLLRINCEGGEYHIFKSGVDLGFLKQVNVIAIAIHGKSKVFLTDEMIEHKIHINNVLRHSGFKQMYGFKFDGTTNKIPTGHVWQVWSRK